ncbi:MAG: hypothetical protein CME62_12975 [Halobacteriovoraceae bacterium]|nr:hypothetical protein [Halobacteriovoraceae bacterium]
MDYKLKNLAFKFEDLVEKPLQDLPVQTIARSHIIHLFHQNKKAMLLLRAGDYIDQEFINHFHQKGLTTIFELPVVSNESIVKYENIFLDLKKAQTEDDKYAARDQFIKHIVAENYDNSQASILDLVIACFNEFYSLPEMVIHKYQENSVDLYSRTLLMSTISVLAAATNNYLDYKFLKDFYNTCFLMDFGLVDYSEISYRLVMACEAERSKPNSGFEVLDKYRAHDSERFVFRHHPKISYDFAKEHNKHFFNPDLVEMIKYHHEKYDGSGFPKGIHYSALSDFETLLTFCDYMIPFQEHHFTKGDGKKVIFDYFIQLYKEQNLKSLPIAKILNNWQKIFNWALKDWKQEHPEDISHEEQAS